ncbi:MAG: ribosome assembly RNA-binding protein YhbY [Proteobacteria bacterium]|nr:ribosome assembly RNA-binding protein YhbY [Pseudomonadota bacterium]
MPELKGFQRKHLRGLAHHFKPVVLVGQKGLTDALVESVDEALDQHELIKIKFNEFKEAARKKEILQRLEEATGCEAVGLIGHTAVLYRRQADPEKRKITVPERESRTDGED